MILAVSVHDKGPRHWLGLRVVNESEAHTDLAPFVVFAAQKRHQLAQNVVALVQHGAGVEVGAIKMLNQITMDTRPRHIDTNVYEWQVGDAAHLAYFQ